VDVLNTLSIFIGDLYWLLKVDKKRNLVRVKVTLFPCVIGTKLNLGSELDVGPVIPWDSLKIIWMSPVDVIAPLACVQ
jgi:hypothetical protein